MNDAHDTLDSTAPDGASSALESRLYAHYAAHASQPPDPETFWQRLAPHLEARMDLSDSSLTLASVAAPSALPSHPTPRPIYPRTTPTPRARGWWLPRAFSGAVALAAVVLLSLATFALLHQRSPLRTPGGQTVQRGQLGWRQITLPPGVILANGAGVVESSNTGASSGHTANASAPNANLVVAAASGAVAYICETPATGGVRLWRTLDAGATWSPLPTLPSAATFASCAVRIDGNDARTVVVQLAPILGAGARGDQSFALFDGAAAWRPLNTSMQAFSSWHGIYYGTSNDLVIGSAVSHLYHSTDGMRTWHALDAPLIAENLAAAQRLHLNGAIGVAQVWVQPQTGALLAQTYDGVLWRSAKQGTTWDQIALPPLPPASELTPSPGEDLIETAMPGAALVVVQAPTSDHPFTLCALVLDQTLTVFNVAPLYCSTNSGQSWVRRPRPTVSQGNGQPVGYGVPDAMLADGSLLAWDVQTIYAFPGNSIQAPAPRALGTIPPPPDPNNIPAGMLGITPDGAVFWQPQNPRTVYVAQYKLPAAAASATPPLQP